MDCSLVPSRPASPNSKIPVTPESSAKLRRTVLEKQIQSQNNCSVVASGTEIVAIPSSSNNNVTLAHAYRRGFVEGSVYTVHTKFHLKLNQILEELQEDLDTVVSVSGPLQRGDSCCQQGGPFCRSLVALGEAENEVTEPHYSVGPICIQPMGSRNTSAVGLVTSIVSNDAFAPPDDQRCHGLERLNGMKSVFVQPAEGCFDTLDFLCPKFSTAQRFNMFHHETLPPIFTIVQTDSQWAKCFGTGTDLRFILNHNDYSSGRLETDLCLCIECTCDKTPYSKFHHGTFLLADSSLQLGNCGYFSANKYNPVLIASSELTREKYLIRSRNLIQGHSDSDFLVYAYDDGGVIDDDETVEPDRTLVAIVSRRVPKKINTCRWDSSVELYPAQERLLITFCTQVHPYAKGTLISSALILKYDLFN